MRPLFLNTTRRRRLTAAGVVWLGYFSLLACFALIGVLFAWRG